MVFFGQDRRSGSDLISRAKLRSPRKYHLDISQIQCRGVKSLIDLPLTAKLDLKIQNPVFHQFGVTGFFGERCHSKFSFPLGLKEETYLGNAADCCLYLTPLKVNGSQAF